MTNTCSRQPLHDLIADQRLHEVNEELRKKPKAKRGPGIGLEHCYQCDAWHLVRMIHPTRTDLIAEWEAIDKAEGTFQ